MLGGRIVVGVDGSAHAARALDYAVDEAQRREATVEAVFAYHGPSYYVGLEFGAAITPPPPEKLEAQAMELLLEALEDVPDHVPVDPVVVEGAPAQALLEAAEGADLLVIGSRGRGGFTGLLLGSTSHKVIGHAPCPVVVIPRSAVEETDGEGRAGPGPAGGAGTAT